MKGRDFKDNELFEMKSCAMRLGLDQVSDFDQTDYYGSKMH